MPDRRRVAAGEAGGFNEEQKLLTAQKRIVLSQTGDARQSSTLIAAETEALVGQSRTIDPRQMRTFDLRQKRPIDHRHERALA